MFLIKFWDICKISCGFEFYSTKHSEKKAGLTFIIPSTQKFGLFADLIFIAPSTLKVLGVITTPHPDFDSFVIFQRVNFQA